MVLKKPVVTEKSMKLADKNLYTFEVAASADKKSVARAVSERFGVKVLAVKIVNIKGKLKMQRRVRKSYKLSDTKKAVVQVEKGKKLSIFETQTEEDVKVTTAEGELASRSEPVVVKEKKDILGKTKVKVEKGAMEVHHPTQRKVITGK